MTHPFAAARFRSTLPAVALLAGCTLLAGCAPDDVRMTGSTSQEISMSTDDKPVTETGYESEPAPSSETGAIPRAALPQTEAEWRKILTPDQYHVTRRHGTERPGSSELLHVKEDGSYKCVCCGQLLFTSKTKYDHGCGWPSFTKPASDDAIGTKADYSFFMNRTEVHCSNCGAHLGHVFDDGPSPLGTRYCMNGVALKFDPAKKQDDDATKPGD